jgi:hypothetical protein
MAMCQPRYGRVRTPKAVALGKRGLTKNSCDTEDMIEVEEAAPAAS